MLLIVTGSVASELEDFGGKVLKHRSEVDGGTRANTLGIVAALEHAVDTADGELQTGLRRARCTLGHLARCARLAARGLARLALARLRRWSDAERRAEASTHHFDTFVKLVELRCVAFEVGRAVCECEGRVGAKWQLTHTAYEGRRRHVSAKVRTPPDALL